MLELSENSLQFAEYGPFFMLLSPAK